MNTQLPTLTDDRILENDMLKINKLYEYFIASEHSQSFFYKNNVESLKYLISEYTIENGNLETEIRKSLEKMYSRYFDEVSVLCSVEPEEEDSNNYTIAIDIQIINNEVSHTLMRSVNVSHNRIDFMKTNNILLYKN